MSNSLPANWITVPIRSLCELKNGRAFKPSEWRQQGLPIVRIQNLNNIGANFNCFDGDYDAKHFLAGGELLFAWSGTPGTSFGAHIWRGGKALLNQHIFRVDIDEQLLDKRYFRHAINQKLNELINVAHGGAGLQHVTKGVFESTEVALPPRIEQQHIADKLDTVLARVDAVNDRLARVAPLLKRFRQSVLAAATSGRLTTDWRGEGTPQNWNAVPYGLVCKFHNGYAFKSEIFKSSGDFQVVKLANIKDGQLKLDASPAFVEAGDVSGQINQQPRPGDILISMTGTRYKRDYGYVCDVPEGAKILVNQRVGRFAPDTSTVSSRFLLLSLMSADFRDQFFDGETGGVNQGNVGSEHIKNCTFLCPPILEQTEIVRRVDLLFAFADRLEARLQGAQTASARLTPALLAKAFRGELVPQDPNDEPAAELLKRLAQSKPATPTKGRKRQAA